LAEVATRAGDSSAQAFRAESSEILERLGVISIPDIVAGARASAPPVTMTTFEFVIDLSLEERRDVNTPDDEPRAPSAIGTSGRRPGD